MSYSERPATSFADLCTLLGPRSPASSVCWCLSHRLDAKINNSLVGPQRGAYVEALTRRDVSPGVLAYSQGEVVDWAAVAPRSELPFARSRKIPHIDDLPAWTVWCIRFRPGPRKQGIAHVVLAGAVEFAADNGAPAVESYPVDNKGARVDLTMAYVGTRGLIESAGFTFASNTTAVSAGIPRVILRKHLREPPRRGLARPPKRTILGSTEAQ